MDCGEMPKKRGTARKRGIHNTAGVCHFNAERWRHHAKNGGAGKMREVYNTTGVCYISPTGKNGVD